MINELNKLYDESRAEGTADILLEIIQGLIVIKKFSSESSIITSNIKIELRSLQDSYDRNEKLLRLAKEIEESNYFLKSVLNEYCFKNLNNLNSSTLTKIIELIERSSDSELTSFMSTIIYQYQTKNLGGTVVSPESINLLLPELMDFTNNSSIIDICAGQGNFIISSKDFIENKYRKEQNISTKFYGCEIHYQSVNEMKINMYLNDIVNIEINHCDVLKQLPLKCTGELEKFDYVISDLPFSSRWDQSYAREEQSDRYKYGIPSSARADWAFIETAIACLNDNGKAILVVNRGALIREQDKLIREGIINDDLVEAVITLPTGLYYGTGIAIELLVINKNKSNSRRNKILFINASEDFEKGKRNQNYLNDSQRMNIINIFKDGIEVDKISKFVDIDLIKKYQYSLNSKEYLEYEKIKHNFENFVNLGEVAALYRGIAISKEAMVELEDKEGYCYINLKDIQEGKIKYDNTEKIALKTASWKEKYAIKEGDIIITAKGSSFKFALVKSDYKDSIISSNLMIIRVNKKKYEPIVLAKFLNSNYGKQLIESIVTGTTMKVINTSKLEAMVLPSYDEETMVKLSKLIKENEETYEVEISEANEKYNKKNKMISSIMDIN